MKGMFFIKNTEYFIKVLDGEISLISLPLMWSYLTKVEKTEIIEKTQQIWECQKLCVNEWIGS